MSSAQFSVAPQKLQKLALAFGWRESGIRECAFFGLIWGKAVYPRDRESNRALLRPITTKIILANLYFFHICQHFLSELDMPFFSG
jgi:hypothetical protein